MRDDPDAGGVDVAALRCEWCGQPVARADQHELTDDCLQAVLRALEATQQAQQQAEFWERNFRVIETAHDEAVAKWDAATQRAEAAERAEAALNRDCHAQRSARRAAERVVAAADAWWAALVAENDANTTETWNAAGAALTDAEVALRRLLEQRYQAAHAPRPGADA